jgi:hypothetical protein
MHHLADPVEPLIDQLVAMVTAKGLPSHAAMVRSSLRLLVTERSSIAVITAPVCIRHAWTEQGSSRPEIAHSGVPRPQVVASPG